MFNHGQKVESGQLRRRLASSEGLVREANDTLQALERRVLASERALIAATRGLPADKPATPGNPATLFLSTAADAGTEILGITAVTERTAMPSLVGSEMCIRDSSKSVLLSDFDQFVGVPELLVPGAFWSVVSDSRVLEVEAYIAPAYTMKYNEIIIPFIGSVEQTIRLHHSNGYHSYTGERTTRCIRHQASREWNGRIVVRSEAAYRIDGKYVHAGVAPYIYQSTWVDSGRVAAQRELDFSGTLTPYQIKAGQTALDNPVYTLNGTPFTGSVAVDAGDVLGVEADLTWDQTVSHLAVSYDLTV